MRPTGRAQVSASNPRALGVCDRCGIWDNLDRLQWQHEWNATQLYNKRLLFCQSCLDVPQQQLRTVILPPDPMPVLNARTENFNADEANPFATTLAQSAAKGDSTIYVAAVSGFANGNNIYVQMTNAGFASVSITAIDTVASSLAISIRLPAVAPQGGTVSLAP